MAYELLFRSGEATRAHFVDGDQATSRVIRNTFMDADLERVVGPYPAHINLTANLLRNGTARLLPRSRVVLEVMEDTQSDPRLLLDLRDLVEDGYTLALDDFHWDESYRPLVEVASMVKVDVSSGRWDELEEHLDELRHFPVELVAVRVETHEVLERCIELGFHLYQGYFLCRPNAVRGRSMPTSRLIVLDAQHVGDGPIAQARLDHHIPADFHGTWVPNTAGHA